MTLILNVNFLRLESAKKWKYFDTYRSNSSKARNELHLQTLFNTARVGRFNAMYVKYYLDKPVLRIETACQ
jgi:hypothetical protein